MIIQEMVNDVIRNREIIKKMIVRDLSSKYKGSMLGIVWSIITPLLLLCVYGFIFTVIFVTKWNVDTSGLEVPFYILMFLGMTIYGLFSECISRAPTVIISQVNLVKKVVFPLEIFTWVIVGSAGIQFCISMLIWFIFYIGVGLPFQATALLFPLLMLPFIFAIAGLVWFFSSLGVYIQDISQTLGVILSAVMFLSPIFFPASAVPKQFAHIIYYNPISYFIEEARNLLIWGHGMNWSMYMMYFVGSLLIMFFGYWWFKKTKKGFADVI